MADLEWSDFRVILALSRGGSIAGAGRLLGVDSSTISRRLAAAEEALGACLILRGGREFCFTCEGRAALEAAQAMEVSITAAKTIISASKKELQGTVKVSCTASLYHFLVSVVDLIMARHPLLRVELVDADHNVNLAKGEADIGLRMLQPVEPDLISRKAFVTCWYIYASSNYIENYGMPQTHEDLRKHRLILYTEDRLRIPGFAWLEQFKNEKLNFARVSRINVALRSALSSAGIAALPAYEVSDNMPLQRIFPEPVVRQQAYVVYHESQRDSVRVHAVVDGLIEFFDQHKAVLDGSDLNKF